MKKTKKLAFSGILTALCFVLLFIGSLFSTIDLSLSAIAGLLIVLAVIELDDKYAAGIFLAVSLLGLLLIPSKLTSLFFLGFLGWYPIAKRHFERLVPLLAWPVKISAANVFLALSILVSRYVFLIPESDFDFSYLLFGLANVTFVLYDICLSKLILLYLVKLRNLLRINKLL
ncbi:MAG: hypothetical protein IJO74_04875 [Clostridia bacterium]|nr:hypothetical protein [Clostridia bacterium]